MIYLIWTIGVFLRIYHLNANDIWFDEALSVAKACGAFTALEPQPPLYFVLLHIWMGILGESVFVIRLFSVIISLISIIFIYKVGRLLFNKQVGITSSLILALSPFHICYAQEARPFSLFTLLTLLSLWLFILAIKADKKRYWIGICLVLAINSYVSYWAFLLIPALSVVFIYKQYRLLIRKWLICVGITLLCFLPWGYTFLRQVAFIEKGFWIPKPMPRQLLVTIENFNLGYNAADKLYILSWIFFGLLFIIGIIYLVKKKNILSLLLTAIFFPIVATFLISQKFPVYLDRHLIAFSVFYYLIIACGWQHLRGSFKFLWIIVYLLLSSGALFLYYTDYMPSAFTHHIGVYTKKPYRPSIEFIVKYSKKDDILVLTSTNLVPSFWYYIKYYYHLSIDYQGQLYNFMLPAAQDGYWRRICTDLPKDIITTPESLHKIINQRRVWLISSSWARDYSLDKNSITAKEYMHKNYRRIFERWFDGILIGLYERGGMKPLNISCCLWRDKFKI